MNPRAAGRGDGRRRARPSDEGVQRRRRAGRCLAAGRAWPPRLPARTLGLRQDHGVAPGRGLPRARPRQHQGRRPRDLRAGKGGAAGAAQHVDDLPELRPLAAHDHRRERRLWPAPAPPAARRDRAARRQHPGSDAAPGVGRPPSRRHLRRPAAARGARPRAGGRAGDPAARRAALQPRRQSARGDALRDPAPPRRLSLHHALCHP